MHTNIYRLANLYFYGKSNKNCGCDASCFVTGRPLLFYNAVHNPASTKYIATFVMENSFSPKCFILSLDPHKKTETTACHDFGGLVFKPDMPFVVSLLKL